MDPKHLIALCRPHMADVRAGSGVAPRKNLFKFIVVKKNYKNYMKRLQNKSMVPIY